MGEANGQRAATNGTRRLAEAVRAAKVASARRTDVVVDIREADRARLEIFAEELQPIVDAVPAEDDGPGSADDADPQESGDGTSPAEKVTPDADGDGLVDGDAREEEAEQAGTETDRVEEPKASAEPVAAEGEVVAVEDAPVTDPVSEDSAPLTDANPSGSDLSESATRLGEAGDERAR